MYVCMFTSDGLVSTKTLVLTKLARIEAELRQQGRLLQSIFASVQPAGSDTCELPEGMLLPVKSVEQLLNLERSIEVAANFQKLVS